MQLIFSECLLALFCVVLDLGCRLRFCVILYCNDEKEEKGKRNIYESLLFYVISDVANGFPIFIMIQKQFFQSWKVKY